MQHILKTVTIAGVILSVLSVSANPIPAQSVVDQSFTAATDLGANINECCAFVAQTFTAGLTGSLAGVNIDVFSPVNSKFPLHVAIHTVTNTGEPGSTILGDTTLNSNAAPLSLLITFPQAINVVAGGRYAIVVNYPGAPPPGANQFQGIWAGATGNLYSGGDLYSSVDGSSWIHFEGDDVHFRTYVTTAIFDTCLRDNSTGNLLQWISTTGSYKFTRCSDGFMLTGTGTVGLVNGTRTLTDSKPDRRISAGLTTQRTGSATIFLQVAPGVWQTFRLYDTNPSSACSCGG